VTVSTLAIRHYANDLTNVHYQPDDDDDDDNNYNNIIIDGACKEISIVAYAPHQ